MTDQTEIPLAPCPFCGGTVKLERALDSYERQLGTRQWWGVVCRSAMNLGGTCAVSIRPQASREAAATRWNLRVPMQALEAANQDLRARVDSLESMDLRK